MKMGKKYLYYFGTVRPKFVMLYLGSNCYSNDDGMFNSSNDPLASLSNYLEIAP